MKYTREVVIDLPRERVIELFDDADNLTKWQEGLQAFEHVSGEPGQPGAKSRLVYDYRGRRFEMTEDDHRAQPARRVLRHLRDRRCLEPDEEPV